MNKSFTLRLVILTFLLICSFANSEQENIRFQHINLEQGLSQESVLSIHQDNEGFMWFGTQEGLNRYDGYQFKVFSHSSRNLNSLSSDWIYSITQSADDKLWLGTRAGINIYNKKNSNFDVLKFDKTDINSIDSNDVRVLFKDRLENIWAGTDKGLNKYLSSEKHFVRYQLNNKLPNINYKILSIAEDDTGKLWIGTDKDGLFRFDPSTEKVDINPTMVEDVFGLTGSQIRSLLVDSSQRLWVGTQDAGLFVFDLKKKQRVFQNSIPEILKQNFITDIFEDKDGSIWLATDSGLFRWDESSDLFNHFYHELDNSNSLSSNHITQLFQDAGGVFWVGSYSGLNKWNTATASFSHYKSNASEARYSLSDNAINAFFDAGENEIWIGTYDGLNLLNTKTGAIEYFINSEHKPDSIVSSKVMSLYAKSNNELFVGHRNSGLSLLNRETGRFENFRHDPNIEHSLSADGVTFIQQGPQGKVWVGTFGGGLNLFDRNSKTFAHYMHDENDKHSLNSNRVLSMLQDSQGLLWVGTFGHGFNILNPTTNTVIRVENKDKLLEGLGSDTVWVIHEDKKGNIWLGTQGGGLNKLSYENRMQGIYEFDKITRYEGLPSNVVYGIVEDEIGSLWLSTNRGISRFDPETSSLLNYDSSHGLQGNEFSTGAFYKSTDGRTFFGGTKGVTAFYPEDISPNSHVPPVVLTKFQKLNEAVSIGSLTSDSNNIEISHKDYLIAFEFAGLDYASPSNNRYKYKLEGFDNEWIEAGDVRKATYTNLPAGNYIFRVKASNNDGIWNEKGTVVALTVLPAPWYSWWAYLIYVLAFFAILYRIYRSYVNKLKEEANYRKKLESEVESRTVELSSANEQLLNASITDQLTGLNNRRYLDSIVEQHCSSVLREFEQVAKAGKSNPENGPRLFFLMFDLDGFKPINDTYGHGAGDKVIVQVGEVLKAVCRKSDTVIRWGGDEFLVMGRVEETSEVEILAERLRVKISENGFDIDLKQKMYLSCSIGYSLYPFSHHYPNALSWEQVHLFADNALYRSKDAGRNTWTGIVQSTEKPPATVMSNFSQNVDSVIEQNFASVKQSRAT